MSKLNGDFHSVSPLRTFFDGNLVEAKTFQSCQISALKETLKATPETSYIFDLSCLQKLIIIGKEASPVTRNYFELEKLEPFQWVAVGTGGIICLNQEKIILVNSYDETLVDGFKNKF